MDDKTQRGRPTAAPLLSKWDYWRVSWLTLACTIIKLVTFARWLPQWDTWWKMAVLEKRTNDREAVSMRQEFGRTQVRDLIKEIDDAVTETEV